MPWIRVYFRWIQDQCPKNHTRLSQLCQYPMASPPLADADFSWKVSHSFGWICTYSNMLWRRWRFRNIFFRARLSSRRPETCVNKTIPLGGFQFLPPWAVHSFKPPVLPEVMTFKVLWKYRAVLGRIVFVAHTDFDDIVTMDTGKWWFTPDSPLYIRQNRVHLFFDSSHKAPPL